MACTISSVLALELLGLVILLVGIVWEERPEREWVTVLLELADLGFNILDLLGHRLHHLQQLCDLQAVACVPAAGTWRPPGWRQRAPLPGNVVETGRIRGMRQHCVRGAGRQGVQRSQHHVGVFCCHLRSVSVGATAFRNGNACSLLPRLWLPALAASCAPGAASCAAGAAALLCPVRHTIFWRRAASKLLADAPVGIRQLRDRVLVAMRMAARFLEGSNQSLAGVQAQGVACAAPKEDVPHDLLGELQRLFPLSVAKIFLPDPQGGQCLCCLRTASHDELLAAFQPSQALCVALPTDNLPGTKQGRTERAFQEAVVI